MKNKVLLGLLTFTSLFCKAQTGAGKFAAFPLEVPVENSLMAKWEKKPVLDSLLIADMENDATWKVTSIGEMSFTQDRAKDGKRSLRFRTSVRDSAYLSLPANHELVGTRTFGKGSQTFAKNGQAGASSVQLQFPSHQDWSGYNRISFWIYVHPTTLPRHNLNLGIRNEGSVSTIFSSARSHYNNDLKPGRWNHVIFEMPHLERNKVSMFSITRELTGYNEGEDGIATYDIDRIQIERVVTDQYEGWNVSPEKFSFSHIGYRPKDSKIALVGSGGGKKFQLINEQKKVVYTGNVQQLDTKNGAFHQLDFSKFQTEGVYRIQSGSMISDPFPIKENVWLQPVFKAMNFYFCQRCGFEVPGLHKECHMDWQGFRGDVKKVINGGYHDAGDLSQGIFRTALASFAMMRNLDVLTQRKDATVMKDSILSEIKWSLQYLLKTRFGDGFHIQWCRMRMFTDNIIGTTDDVLVPAQNLPWTNFLAAAVEAKAAKLLAKSDPELASQLNHAAIDDWEAGVASKKVWDEATMEEASWGATSSLELALLTGDEKYKKQAAVFGKLIIQCQEQSFVQGIPITGYFYANSKKQRVIHNRHTAFEEAPLIALAMLCNEMPQHENWIDWYSSAVLYSDFFMKRGSKISAPFNMLPNSVWSKKEIMTDANEKRREAALLQFNDGTRLSDEFALRTFPIWNDNLFHGNTNVQLSNTWALAEAAKLRKDAEGMKLVGKQLEWVLGANPFGQSLMYGVGYDFAPQFVYCLKGIVGGLPVGMDSRAGDMPFWPATNSATFKELWIEPVNRFMGAVSVYSSLDQTASAKKAGSNNLDIKTETVQSVNGTVSVTITLTGSGKHDIEIKIFNAKGNITNKHVNLIAKKAQKILLELKVEDRNKPYVAVIVGDKNPDLRKEIVGSYNNTESVLVKK